MLPPTFEHRIGLFLGHTKLYEYDNLRYFHIYIHERGQFWPRELDYQSHIKIKRNQYKVLRFASIEHQDVSK